ncbi:hypothetical protein [Streptomyces poonensis]|uniref:Uncharacterized protein n=1 Tax=Streptomyces poonensis TaxID=68255 RepID=A0A918QBK7_9ACTN|nr:hypothetical protein [Streptomyces poonensis]GGZ39217.1 hypothetical protein GCM10010365_69960 [Streptomyces poonensis]GLJ93112.1 hypothetical protein GCM10017589_57240 [Streptomyces poonensis]
MEGREAQANLDEVAFVHPGTRTAWAKARRAVIMRLSAATFLFVAVFIALSLLHGFDVISLPSANGKPEDTLGLILTLALFVYLTFLYLYVGALRSSKRIRRILEAHPWQPIPGARRQPLVKDASGVPIQLQLSTMTKPSKSSDIMSARGIVHRRRWPEAMEQGAWYAGDAEKHGVLALPDGSELMEVSPRYPY